MENCKIFYKFRNGDCLVVPEDGYWVNGKCIDVCREDAIVIDHNPYHDKKGRFTTKTGSGSGMTAGNVNQVIELIKNKKVPLFGVPMVVKEMGISREEYNELKNKYYPKEKPTKKGLTPEQKEKLKRSAQNMNKEFDQKQQNKPQTVLDRELEVLSNECGVSREIALKYRNTLEDWMLDGYDGIRAVQTGRTKGHDYDFEYSPERIQGYKERAAIIEDFIDKAPKFKGAVYRGIALDNMPFKKGMVIDMAGTSSWSASEKVAKGFANSKINKEHCVNFTAKKVSKGVELDHIFKGDEIGGEQEVLVSKDSKFKVIGMYEEKVSVGVVNRRMTHVTLEEVL